MRKPSGGERAWFLEEESEQRNKVIFLAGKNHRADVSVYRTESLADVRGRTLFASQTNTPGDRDPLSVGIKGFEKACKDILHR